MYEVEELELKGASEDDKLLYSGDFTQLSSPSSQVQQGQKADGQDDSSSCFIESLLSGWLKAKDEGKLPPTEGSYLKSGRKSANLGIENLSIIECAIEVNNYHSSFTLKDPVVEIKGGAVRHEARWANCIQPKTRDAFVTRGDALFNTIPTSGTYGTASWRIDGENRRVVVMWSASCTIFHGNWLAVGFTKDGTKSSYTWFYAMYANSENAPLQYILERFERSPKNSGKPRHQRFVCCRYKGLEVRGTMRGRKKVEVQIAFSQYR